MQGKKHDMKTTGKRQLYSYSFFLKNAAAIYFQLDDVIYRTAAFKFRFRIWTRTVIAKVSAFIKLPHSTEEISEITAVACCYARDIWTANVRH